MRIHSLALALSSLSFVLVGAAGSTALVIGTEGCGNTDCSCSGALVTVFFDPGITTDAVTSFTTTTPDVCGPAPPVPCIAIPPPNDGGISPGGCAPEDGFYVEMPANAAGTCAIHVALKSGKVIDSSVHVSVSHDGCCSGPAGDEPIHISASP